MNRFIDGKPKSIIYVDIDGTIANEVFNEDGSKDYMLHTPMRERIDHINGLYMDGHKIVYNTARGAKSGIDWFQRTHEQLMAWGCLFDELIVGKKPHYDLCIDDKVVNSEMYFQLIKLQQNPDLR
jgi:hypothetical protein